MKSKESVQQEIDALQNKDDWGTHREIKMLPDLLDETETIKALCSGQKRKLPSGNLVDILLVCTDRRLLMVDRGLFSAKTDDIALSNITGIERKDGLFFSKIIIRTNNKKPLKLRHIDKAAAQSLCMEVQNGKEVKVVVESSDKKASVAEELKELKELVDDGILTQEEFEAKKKQVLGI